MNTTEPSSRSATLSVVMIVLNEGKHLRDCLANVQSIANEIVILDAGSTDETAEIAAEFGAAFHTNSDWQGFGKQRQRAQANANGDYVLMMDADEQLNDRLKEAITKLLQQPVDRRQAFAVSRRNTYFGRYAYKFGRGERLFRLYARDKFEFHNQKVHESLNCDPSKSILLPGTLIHHICDSLLHLKKKQLRYSIDWAEMKAGSGKRVSVLGAHWRAAFAFFREYILHGAFLSGGLGFTVAAEAGVYTLNKYMLLWEINRQAKKQ